MTDALFLADFDDAVAPGARVVVEGEEAHHAAVKRLTVGEWADMLGRFRHALAAGAIYDRELVQLVEPLGGVLEAFQRRSSRSQAWRVEGDGGDHTAVRVPGSGGATDGFEHPYPASPHRRWSAAGVRVRAPDDPAEGRGRRPDDEARHPGPDGRLSATPDPPGAPA